MWKDRFFKVCLIVRIVDKINDEYKIWSLHFSALFSISTEMKWLTCFGSADQRVSACGSLPLIKAITMTQIGT